jgi:Family of unknown function (DUF5684)
MDTYDSGAAGGIMALGAGFLIFNLVIAAVFIVAGWKVYTKAGKPGWAVLIPIYSAIVLLDIVGKPWWWFLLMLIPVVNLIFIIIVMHRLSLSFGQGVGTTILLLLGIGFLILGFGSAKYVGPPQP